MTMYMMGSGSKKVETGARPDRRIDLRRRADRSILQAEDVYVKNRTIVLQWARASGVLVETSMLGHIPG